jgi:predicted RNase H-like HicB family nuclease
MYYLSIVTKETDGFGFIIPDVDGYTAFAKTNDFDAAVAIARRVLAGHLAAVIDAGGSLPKARSLVDIKNDSTFAEDFEEALSTLMIPAILPAGRTKRVNLTFDENTLNIIDNAASDRQLTRSAYLAEAARQFAIS